MKKFTLTFLLSFLFFLSHSQELQGKLGSKESQTENEISARFADVLSTAHELRLLYEDFQKQNKSGSKSAFKTFLSSPLTSKKTKVKKVSKKAIHVLNAYNQVAYREFHAAQDADIKKGKAVYHNVPRTPIALKQNEAIDALLELAFEDDDLKGLYKAVYEAPAAQKMDISHQEARRRMRNLDLEGCRDVYSICRANAVYKRNVNRIAVVFTAGAWTLLTFLGPVTFNLAGLSVSAAVIASSYVNRQRFNDCYADYRSCERAANFK